jgi:hypothetical protein
MSNVAGAVSSVFLLATCMMAIFGNQPLVNNQDLDFEQDIPHNENAFANLGHRKLQGFENLEDNLIENADEEDHDSDEDDKDERKKNTNGASNKDDVSMAEEGYSREEDAELEQIQSQILTPIETQIADKKYSFKLI